MKKSLRLCAVPDCGKSLSPRNRHGYCLEHREHAPHRKTRKPYQDRYRPPSKYEELEKQNAKLVRQIEMLKASCRKLEQGMEELFVAINALGSERSDYGAYADFYVKRGKERLKSVKRYYTN